MLYGRRRVGKTELLNEFMKGKQAVFYTCTETPDREQLERFSKRVLASGIPAARYIQSFQDWESALGSVVDVPSQGKKILIIDEFPYMCRGNPAIPSILQTLWDQQLKRENVMIILCGSAMSFIEKQILGEKNPLYGRATGIYKLAPMSFQEAQQFFRGIPWKTSSPLTQFWAGCRTICRVSSRRKVWRRISKASFCRRGVCSTVRWSFYFVRSFGRAISIM